MTEIATTVGATVYQKLSADCVRQLKEKPWQIAVAREEGVSLFGRFDRPGHLIVHIVVDGPDTPPSIHWADWEEGNIRYVADTAYRNIY